LECIKYLFDNYIKIKKSIKAERKSNNEYEGIHHFYNQLPEELKKSQEELITHIKYMQNIIQNETIATILVTNNNLYNIFFQILCYFKQEKFYNIKSMIYNIFSNIFTLDNRYLQV